MCHTLPLQVNPTRIRQCMTGCVGMVRPLVRQRELERCRGHTTHAHRSAYCLWAGKRICLRVNKLLKLLVAVFKKVGGSEVLITVCVGQMYLKICTR